MKDNIADLVKAAAEAAKHAPEHLQEAAFSKAFDALVAAGAARNDAHSAQVHAKVGNGNGRPAAAGNDGNSLDQLNRTDHPDIGDGSSGLVNALRLLKAAKEDLDIDGLSATQLARVLTGKFRFRITPQALGRALNDAGRLVDRQKLGNDVVFRIMDPGERFLENPGASPATNGKTGKRRHGKAATKPLTAQVKSPAAAPGVAQPKKGASRSAFGPSAAMEQLYNAGYFKTPRSIASIIASLKHDAGRAYKPNELSPALLRWLRGGKLSRRKNADGQYEYAQA